MKDKNFVDAYINDELNSKEKVVKSLLNIPYSGKEVNVAARVEDLVYASTRLGNLQKTDEGYQIDVTGNDKLPGKKYDLREAGTSKLLQQGKIAVKAASAKVIDLPKTGTK